MRLFFRLVISFVVGVAACWFLFSKLDGNKDHKTVTTHQDVVERIESIGRLELVRMNVRDVVEHQFVRQWLPNASALLIISGEAVGCIDLQQITPEDIDLSGDTLRMKLPQPILCYCKINHKESKVYETRYDYLTGANLVDGAYQEAEKQLEKTVLASGILDQTKQNAIVFFKSFFGGLGFSYVDIYF